MESKKSFGEIIGGEKPVLVDFFATWCGPCQMMQPILADLAGRVGDEATILKIDVDRNPSAAMKYRVNSVPTLMIFKNGEIKWRQSGVVQAHQLEQLLKQA